MEISVYFSLEVQRLRISPLLLLVIRCIGHVFLPSFPDYMLTRSPPLEHFFLPCPLSVLYPELYSEIHRWRRRRLRGGKQDDRRCHGDRDGAVRSGTSSGKRGRRGLPGQLPEGDMKRLPPQVSSFSSKNATCRYILS